MKKTISCLAVFCLVLALLPVAAFGSETAIPTPLFDLSLEGSVVGSAPVVSNKVTTDAVTDVNTDNLRENTRGNTPIYKTEENGAIKYLTFSYYDEYGSACNKGSEVNVVFKDTEGGKCGLADENALSFEFWARPTSYDAWSSMFSLAFNGGKAEAFVFRLNTTPAYFFLPDRQTNNNIGMTSASASAHMNRWNHYVVTRVWDSANSKWKCDIYVNGVSFASLVSSSTTSKTTYASQNYNWNTFIIGNTMGNDNNKAFEGDIAEFRIYNTGLTAAQASAAYTNTKDLYYPSMQDNMKVFDMNLAGSTVGQAPVVTDESGSRLVKEINVLGHPSSSTADDGDTPTYLEEDGVKYLKFASCDGTTLANRRSQVNVQFKDTSLTDKNALTFEAWARADWNGDTSNWGALASIGRTYKGGGANDKVALRFMTGGTIQLYPDREAQDAALNTTINFRSYEGVWAHYVVTREYNEATSTWTTRGYVNGEQVSNTANLTKEMSKYTGAESWLAIGGATGADSERSFIGDIADFKLYTKALSADEVAANYAAEAGKYIKSEVTVSWKDSEGSEISSVSGLTQVTADISATNYFGTEPNIFLACYNGDQLVKVMRVDATVTDNTAAGSATISWSEADSINKVKAFIWNDGLSPLCQPYCL